MLLGAGEEVAELGFSVNARGCRGTDEGLDLLRDVADARKLPNVVVFALGSNDVVTRADLVSALQMLGLDRVLRLVTPVDRIHLTPEGQQAMARMYRRALPDRFAKRTIPRAHCRRDAG